MAALLEENALSELTPRSYEAFNNIAPPPTQGAILYGAGGKWLALDPPARPTPHMLVIEDGMPSWRPVR